MAVEAPPNPTALKTESHLLQQLHVELARTTHVPNALLLAMDHGDDKQRPV